MDSAIAAAVEHITETKPALGILALVEAGADIASITDMLVTAGIGAGKWQPDTAILMAGPLARTIEIMAKGYGLTYKLGIEEDDRQLPTAATFARMSPGAVDQGKAQAAARGARERIGEVQARAAQVEGEKPAGGLMGATDKGPAPKALQQQMLGGMA